MKCTLRDAFDRWNIAETPADNIEDVGMRCSILGRDKSAGHVNASLF
jgi:hypothetical protein